MEALRHLGQQAQEFLENFRRDKKPLVSPRNLLVRSAIVSFNFPPEGGNRLVSSYLYPEAFSKDDP